MASEGMKMSKSLGNTSRPAQGDGGIRRRHHPAVGAVGRLYRGPPIGPRSSRAWPTSTASCATPFRYLLGALDGFERARAGRESRDARARALRSGAAGRARREAEAGGSRTSTSTPTPAR
jgi:hypothetical protein